MKDKVIIYTDGACKGNPGVGGWGAILSYKEESKKIDKFNYRLNFILFYLNSKPFSKFFFKK